MHDRKLSARFTPYAQAVYQSRLALGNPHLSPDDDFLGLVDREREEYVYNTAFLSVECADPANGTLHAVCVPVECGDSAASLCARVQCALTAAGAGSGKLLGSPPRAVRLVRGALLDDATTARFAEQVGVTFAGTAVY
jgi:hypothetical protein